MSWQVAKTDVCPCSLPYVPIRVSMYVDSIWCIIGVGPTINFSCRVSSTTNGAVTLWLIYREKILLCSHLGSTKWAQCNPLTRLPKQMCFPAPGRMYRSVCPCTWTTSGALDYRGWAHNNFFPAVYHQPVTPWLIYRENIALFLSRQHGLLDGAKLDWNYAQLMFDDSSRKLIRWNQWYTISKKFNQHWGHQFHFIKSQHHVAIKCSLVYETEQNETARWRGCFIDNLDDMSTWKQQNDTFATETSISVIGSSSWETSS
jgi:hypothetical protein